MIIPAYPLSWPPGWKRTPDGDRSPSRFGKSGRRGYNGDWTASRQLTIAEAVARLRIELDRMGVKDDDLVISTNLELRLDGLPRSNQREPADPGAAVYWLDENRVERCMAIDRYDRVADNLAAVAATLDAMRAIERHGGAEILNRAFTGFTALDAPAGRSWHDVLGVPAHASTDAVREAYRRGRSMAHPDREHGDAELFSAIQRAWQTFCAERGLSE